MQSPTTSPSRRAVLFSWLAFVGSAAIAAVSVQVALNSPVMGVCMGVIIGVLAFRHLQARRRFRTLILSGDVKTLLAAWEPALEESVDRRTLGPLMRATALAAHGLTDRARQVLDLAQEGPTWDEAIEHRLVLSTLLFTLEGEPEQALRVADKLNALPLPASRWSRSRTITLRQATCAFARTFAERGQSKDRQWLRLAARHNPLLLWPMRYAEAIECVRSGKLQATRKLLQDVPNWPQESAFFDITQQLKDELSHRSATRTPNR